MSEKDKPGDLLPTIPDNLWNTNPEGYPPMEFYLEKIGKVVKKREIFDDDIFFKDTGETLHFICKKDEVLITSPDGYKIELGLSLIDRKRNAYAISGVIKTKINKQHHPNLRAKLMFNYILGYFDDVNPGINISQFSALWSMNLDLRDNYEAFRMAEGTHTEKALATPSGKIAQSAGFTEVEYLGQDNNDGHISVLFKKPTSTSAT